MATAMATGELRARGDTSGISTKEEQAEEGRRMRKEEGEEEERRNQVQE